MKITTFNPMIITAHPEAAIKVFEDLGFERHHEKIGIDHTDASDVRMKDANGNYVDVLDVFYMKEDRMAIRMNVDNFEEAYDFLIAKGFKNVSPNSNVVDTGSSKTTILKSPSGFSINLSQHIKK